MIYADAIAARQVEESKLGFENHERPEWYLDGNEPVSEAGRDNGLKPDMYKGTAFTCFEILRLFL